MPTDPQALNFRAPQPLAELTRPFPYYDQPRFTILLFGSVCLLLVTKMYVDVEIAHCSCDLAAHKEIGTLDLMGPHIVVNCDMDALSIAAIKDQKSLTVNLAVDSQDSRSEGL